MTEPRTKAGKALLAFEEAVGAEGKAAEATATEMFGRHWEMRDAILAIEAEAAHPDGYSEPPEPVETAIERGRRNKAPWEQGIDNPKEVGRAIANAALDAGEVMDMTSEPPEPCIRVCFDGVHVEGCSHAFWPLVSPGSGYSEPPEPGHRPDLSCPKCGVNSHDNNGEGWTHACDQRFVAALDALPDRFAVVSGYSESGERDREAAVNAALVLSKVAHDLVPGIRHDFGLAALDYLDANPEAAATLAAYLRGASPLDADELANAMRAADVSWEGNLDDVVSHYRGASPQPKGPA